MEYLVFIPLSIKFLFKLQKNENHKFLFLKNIIDNYFKNGISLIIIIIINFHILLSWIYDGRTFI
jgi:hypothetical protein